MVKSLKFFAHSFKWLLLLSLLLVLGLGFWLHGGERSLRFAKPWIESTINTKDAPFTIGIGDVVIDWRNGAELGRIKISGVTFARRNGNVFAQLPELYATIDPIGFLPNRRLLNKVILRKPRIFITRNIQGVTELGIEGAPERLPMLDLIGFLEGASSDKPLATPVLPFHDFIIDDAHLTFIDEFSETNIISEAFDLRLTRRHGSYDAVLALPFTVDAVPVMLSAGLRTLPDTHEHVLAVQMRQMPSRLVCLFGTCPKGVEAEGAIDGKIALGIGQDMSAKAFRATFSTNKAKVTMPEWFAEPLKLGASSITAEGDIAKQEYRLAAAKFQLEDTALTATAQLRKAEDGWYVTADASCAQLDIKKLYKYWPLTMAPDSRTWVTSKLKSGYAASGKLKLNLMPADFSADFFSDKSVDAVADAREITFEYLPGFPLAQKMNGIAHFTGTTVKVEGGSGTLMDGTKVNHAVLWCPELHSKNNPMEATLDITAPASDAATMLALKHFVFDDHMGLDPKLVKGTVNSTMKLKFNAFSDKPSSDPNEIHLEAVDYDITTKLSDVAQKDVFGGYDTRALNGTLATNNAGIDFNGSLMLGESAVNDIVLKQRYGQALSLAVKGRAAEKGSPTNDFELHYASGVIPDIRVSGKRLDATVSYGSKENSLLADFPAMNLTMDLGELVLAKEASFTDIKGTLRCTQLRCESADIDAQAGKASIKTTITQNAGKRQFLMTASDAGSMLKALDITDRMTGGRYELRGTYNDGKSPPALIARLLITDFTLKNSQILGRIFSIGSLTGLANMLTGSGIAFEKLSANLLSQAGIISVDKGVASGASMGITVGGMVDTNTTKLDLKGVVAPAYALNSILGKIPLIGAIAGGDEGLIAFNYSVKGTYAEPDVGVNPLSGLTPGFLRGIFGGGESNARKLDAGEKGQDNQPVEQKMPGAARRP
jgi:hypothetical protein